MLLTLPVQLYVLELVSIQIIHIRSATSNNSGSDKTSVAEEVSQTVQCVSDVRGTYYLLLTTSFHRFVTRPLGFWKCEAAARIAIILPPALLLLTQTLFITIRYLKLLGTTQLKSTNFGVSAVMDKTVAESEVVAIRTYLNSITI
jgi:hypothetical protein